MLKQYDGDVNAATNALMDSACPLLPSFPGAIDRGERKGTSKRETKWRARARWQRECRSIDPSGWLTIPPPPPFPHRRSGKVRGRREEGDKAENGAFCDAQKACRTRSGTLAGTLLAAIAIGHVFQVAVSIPLTTPHPPLQTPRPRPPSDAPWKGAGVIRSSKGRTGSSTSARVGSREVRRTFGRADPGTRPRCHDDAFLLVTCSAQQRADP